MTIKNPIAFPRKAVHMTGQLLRPMLGKARGITKRDESYLIDPQAGGRRYKRRNI